MFQLAIIVVTTAALYSLHRARIDNKKIIRLQKRNHDLVVLAKELLKRKNELKKQVYKQKRSQQKVIEKTQVNLRRVVNAGEVQRKRNDDLVRVLREKTKSLSALQRKEEQQNVRKLDFIDDLKMDPPPESNLDLLFEEIEFPQKRWFWQRWFA